MMHGQKNTLSYIKFSVFWNRDYPSIFRSSLLLPFSAFIDFHYRENKSLFI